MDMLLTNAANVSGQARPLAATLLKVAAVLLLAMLLGRAMDAAPAATDAWTPAPTPTAAAAFTA